MVLRVLEKLRPAAFERYEWSGLESVQRYLGVSVFVVVCLTIDCNNFFYKYLAWIPASHRLVIFRVTLWGWVAVATSKEWYEYVSNPNSNRLGPFAWLTFYTCGIELSTIYKFRGNEFVNKFPLWIQAIWIALGFIYLVGLYKAF